MAPMGTHGGQPHSGFWEGLNPAWLIGDVGRARKRPGAKAPVSWPMPQFLSLPCQERFIGVPSQDMGGVSIRSKELRPKEAWNKRAGPRKPPPQTSPSQTPKKDSRRKWEAQETPQEGTSPRPLRAPPRATSHPTMSWGPLQKGRACPTPEGKERMDEQPLPPPHSVAATGASVEPTGVATGAPDEHHGDVQTNADVEMPAAMETNREPMPNPEGAATPLPDAPLPQCANDPPPSPPPAECCTPVSQVMAGPPKGRTRAGTSEPKRSKTRDYRTTPHRSGKRGRCRQWAQTPP